MARASLALTIARFGRRVCENLNRDRVDVAIGGLGAIDHPAGQVHISRFSRPCLPQRVVALEPADFRFALSLGITVEKLDAARGLDVAPVVHVAGLKAHFAEHFHRPIANLLRRGIELIGLAVQRPTQHDGLVDFLARREPALGGLCAAALVRFPLGSGEVCRAETTPRRASTCCVTYLTMPEITPAFHS